MNVEKSGTPDVPVCLRKMKLSLLFSASVLVLSYFAVAGPVGKVGPSLLLDLPDEIWSGNILPGMSTKDAGKLRASDKKLYSMVESRLKDYSAVAEACGNKTAKVLV